MATDYGIILKNADGGIQVDSQYKNYTLHDSGVFDGPTALFTETKRVPIFAAKSYSTSWTAIGTMMVSKYKVWKSSGGNGWDRGVYSPNAQFNTASAKGRPSQNNKIVTLGLDADPNLIDTYTSVDYCLYGTASGGLNVYESGSLKYSSGTYSAGDLLEIYWDGNDMHYKKNGTTFYSTANVDIVASTSFVSLIYHQDAELYDVSAKDDSTYPNTVLRSSSSTTEYIGTDFIGNRMIGTTNTDWIVFIEQPTVSIPDYGFVVYNSSGDLVFSSAEKYFRIMSINIITHAADAYDDVTVIDANNNYFFLIPSASIGYFSGGSYIYVESWKTINSTTIRCAYQDASSDSIIDSSFPSYSGILVEVAI